MTLKELEERMRMCGEELLIKGSGTETPVGFTSRRVMESPYLPPNTLLVVDDRALRIPMILDAPPLMPMPVEASRTFAHWLSMSIIPHHETEIEEKTSVHAPCNTRLVIIVSPREFVYWCPCCRTDVRGFSRELKTRPYYEKGEGTRGPVRRVNRSLYNSVGV